MVAAIRAAKEAVDVPVIVKLSPLGREMTAAAQAAKDAGADAIAAINSFGPCLGIDTETGLPLMGSADGYGWLSGQAIKALSLRCVFDIARTVDLPIIGVGGISSGADAIEFIMAGAWAVQICTAAILRGPSIYGKVAQQMEKWLDEHGYESLKDVRGLAIRRWQELQPHTFTVPVLYNEAECIGCGLCELSCHYDAIWLEGDVALFDPQRCFGCGLCAVRCPTHALLMPRVESGGQIIHPLTRQPI